MIQSHHSLSIRTILDIDCLQLIQDAFSSTFHMPCMIIDPEGQPVTEPSNWQVVCDRVNEKADIPQDCQRRLGDLLLTCAEDGLPASSVCPNSGLTTSMVPIFIDDTLIGAWILDQVRIDDDVPSPTSVAKRRDDAHPETVPPSFSLEEFDLIFDLLLTVNTAVMQLAKTNREMAIRDMQLRGINDQMDATNAMLRKFIDYSHVAMYISDYYTGEILMGNRAYCQLVNLDPDAILGKKCYEVNGMGDDGFCTFCPRERLLDQNNQAAKPQTWVYFNTHFNLWLRCTTQAIVWSHGRLAQLVTQLDVTQEYRMQEELRHLAFTDRHTGLYNSQKLLQDVQTHQAVRRRNTTKRIGRGADTVRRTKNTLDFVCFDLSSLRAVGDAFGSETANELLKVILEWFAAQDFGLSTLYHIDPDQYCIAVKDGSADDIGLVANRIAARFTKSWLVRMHGSETPIFVNVFVSILYATRDNLLQEDILGLMGRTLESARERQRVVVFDEEIDQKTRERLRLDTSLIACVKKGMENFEVHFQPIVHLKAGTWSGLEVLCRWRDPETGPVSPMVFIPAAERLGLIGTLGLWVLDNAVLHAKTWGLDKQDGFFLSVNISPLQMMDETFADKVGAVLRRHDFPGFKVSLEVTESTEFTFTSFTRTVTRQLKELGVRLALDDFGTGYSSFNNLKNLPVNFLKTEAAFIRGIESDSYMQYFFYILSELAHANEMKLIAEGVETREQLEIVRKNGADYIQGYLFSKPLTPEDLAEQLHRFTYKEEILADIDQESIDVTQWLDGKSAYALAPNLIRLLNHCLHILLSDVPLDESFEAVLEKAGMHFDLDRTFAVLKPDNAYRPVHEWCGETVRPQREKMLSTREGGFPDCLHQAIDRDGMILSADIAAMPGEMFPFLDPEENRALAMMPLWNDEELVGVVGFGYAAPHAWTPDAIIVLQNLALIMTNCLNREALKTRAGTKSQVITDVLRRSGMNILVADVETREILWLNDTIKERYRLGDELLGWKCHEVLHGRDTRCVECRWDQTTADSQIHRFDRGAYSEIWGRTFNIFESLVEWEPGRKVCIEYLIDVTDMQAASGAGSPHGGDPDEVRFQERLETILDSTASDGLSDVAMALIRIDADAVGAEVGPEETHLYMDRVRSSIKACIRTDDLVGMIDQTRLLGVFPGCPRNVAETRLAQATRHFGTVFPGLAAAPFAYGFIDAGFAAGLGAKGLLNALRHGAVGMKLEMMGIDGN